MFDRNVVYSYADACNRHNEDERHSLLEQYTSHFIWKVCVWERVGDRTELQHIHPHTIGHNCVSFPFSWAAQPGSWGPILLGVGFLYRTLSPTSLVSKLTDFLSTPSYIIVQRPPSWGRHNPLIQSVHGQGYILIFLERIHLLFA